jgi:PilZ domain
MGTFGKCKGGGRRLSGRTAAPLMAVVTTLKESKSAVLKDVSATGARVCGHGLPAVGGELFLTIEQIVAFGKVVRAEDNERGIAFDEPLSATDEQFLQQRIAEAGSLPPEIRAAFNDWSLGFAR